MSFSAHSLDLLLMISVAVGMSSAGIAFSSGLAKTLVSPIIKKIFPGSFVNVD